MASDGGYASRITHTLDAFAQPKVSERAYAPHITTVRIERPHSRLALAQLAGQSLVVGVPPVDAVPAVLRVHPPSNIRDP